MIGGVTSGGTTIGATDSSAAPMGALVLAIASFHAVSGMASRARTAGSRARAGAREAPPNDLARCRHRRRDGRGCWRQRGSGRRRRHGLHDDLRATPGRCLRPERERRDRASHQRHGGRERPAPPRRRRTTTESFAPRGQRDPGPAQRGRCGVVAHRRQPRQHGVDGGVEIGARLIVLGHGSEPQAGELHPQLPARLRDAPFHGADGRRQHGGDVVVAVVARPDQDQRVAQLPGQRSHQPRDRALLLVVEGRAGGRWPCARRLPAARSGTPRRRGSPPAGRGPRSRPPGPRRRPRRPPPGPPRRPAGRRDGAAPPGPRTRRNRPVGRVRPVRGPSHSLSSSRARFRLGFPPTARG